MGSKSGIDGVLDVAVVSGGGGGDGGGAITAAAGAIADGAITTLGSETDAANTTPTSAGTLMSFLKGAVSQIALLAGGLFTPYKTPDSRNVVVASNMAILFSDDFGGTSLDTTVRWNEIDGGLAANPSLNGGGTLTQAKIGSGISMMTTGSVNVSGSNLVVNMGTTQGSEHWLLSKQVFSGTEDLFFTLIRSEALAANSIFVGLVEVDPTTLCPLINPNIAADANGSSYFTNMGGVEFGQTTTATAYVCQAIGDSSGAIATGSTAVALAALTTNSEFQIEFHAEDVIGSNAAVDSAGAKSVSPSRVSSQAPNDGKMYKLLLRFRNIGASAPASATTVTIGRAIAVDSQELRVEVASGRGDANAQKALAVNIANAPAVTLTGSTNGVFLSKNGSQGLALSTFSRLTGAAATGEIKASSGILYTYDLLNTNAAVRYLQFYGSSSTTFGSQGVPVFTVGIPPGAKATFDSDIGCLLGGTGMSWAITTDAPGADEGAAADITGWLSFL
jgi:hypothetical protein